jgi:hypothetical protein
MRDPTGKVPVPIFPSAGLNRTNCRRVPLWTRFSDGIKTEEFSGSFRSRLAGSDISSRAITRQNENVTALIAVSAFSTFIP